MATSAKLAHCSYLIKRPCGYLFRIRIPTSIKDKFRATELRFSLKTDSVRLAQKRAIIFADYVRLVFAEIERGGYMSQLSDSEIRKMIKERIKQWLEEDEEWRVRGICKGADIDSPQLDYSFYAERQGKNNVMLANSWYFKEDIPREIYERDLYDIGPISNRGRCPYC